VERGPVAHDSHADGGRRMSEENPYRMPSPEMVAKLCARTAWKDDLNDETRLLLEWSADTIRRLMRRLVRQALHLERAEAKE